MLGEKIKQLRNEKGLTQKELADMLFVTAQAVSRWENDEVEPSLATISQMSQIFGVTVDELIGVSAEKPIQQAEKPMQPAPQVETPAPQAEKPPQQVVVEKKIIYKEARPVLGVCRRCNKPIYDGNEIVRVGKNDKIYCKACHKKNQEEALNSKIEYGKSQRTKSFVWSGIWTAIILLAAIFTVVTKSEYDTGLKVSTIIGSLLFFPFFSCLYLKNNFIGEMFLTIAEWGFVRFPTLIFTLDLDGIIWLITVKLIFFVLGILIALAVILLALVLSLFVSAFVYPFALIHNINHPEDTGI